MQYMGVINIRLVNRRLCNMILVACCLFYKIKSQKPWRDSCQREEQGRLGTLRRSVIIIAAFLRELFALFGNG